MSSTGIIKTKRRRKNHVIRVLMVQVVLLAYTIVFLYFLHQSRWGPFAVVRQNLFLVFCLNMGGMLFCMLYNEQRMDRFLRDYPALGDREGMERLKPILRTHMYLGVLALLMTGNSLGTGLGIFIEKEFLQGFIVLGTWLLSLPLLTWCSHTENKMYQIQCTNQNLEPEVELLIKDWSTRIFPNF